MDLGADLTRWADTLVPTASRFVKRDATRLFAGVVDRLAEKLESLHAGGRDEVGRGEYERLLGRMTVALETSGTRRLDYAQVNGGTPSAVAAALAPLFADLADESAPVLARYAHGVLELCAFMLKEWATGLPQVRGAAEWGLFVESPGFATHTRSALEGAFRAVDVPQDETSRVASAQRYDLISELGHMELFGVPVPDEYRRVPIDVSYLSTGVSGAGAGRSPLRLLEADLTGAFRPDSSDGPLRLVLVGRAGSGKTTAVQWVAFRSARREMPRGTRQRILLPFFVRLRGAPLQTDRPSDSALLLSGQLRDSVSGGWLDTLAETFDPIFVFDGWDEVSGVRARRAAAWIRSLTDRFPAAHVVATTRPERLDDFLDELPGFTGRTVAPLSPEGTRDLVGKWFDGLLAQRFANPSIPVDAVREAQRRLLVDLQSVELADMADNPLFASMLCCLYASKRSHAPHSRAEVYERVVHALVHAREYERISEEGSDWRDYPEKAKYVLLGYVARAMTKSGSLAVGIDSPLGAAERSLRSMVEDVLPTAGYGKAMTERMTDSLLQRSVVLHRIALDEAAFVHRSIQEFFAAHHFRVHDDAVAAFDAATDGSWAVLPFACDGASAAFNDDVVRRLLGLLERRRGDERRHAQTVLVECLASATQLDAGLRATAEDALSEMFPLRGDDEVRILAGLGNAAVPLLLRHRDDGVARGRTIETLARIGSTEAQSALSTFADTADALDAARLVEAWPRFDPGSYARAVLALLPGPITLHVVSPARLAALRDVDNVGTVTVARLELDRSTRVALENLASVVDLTLRECGLDGPPTWSRRLDRLVSLSVLSCTGAGSLGRLATRSLRTLRLETVQASGVDWYELCDALPGLNVLWLADLRLPGGAGEDEHGSDVVVPGEAMGALGRLRTLVLRSGVRVDSLSFLSRTTLLRRLELGWGVTTAEIRELGRCPGLRQLALTLRSDGEELYSLSALRRLRELRVSHAGPLSLATIPAEAPVEKLVLRSCLLRDLDGVSVPPTVRRVEMEQCVVTGDPALALDRSDRDNDSPWARPSRRRRPTGQTPTGWDDVEHVVWRGAALEDLELLSALRSVRVVEILDAGGLRSLAGVGYLPHDARLRLVGCSALLDDRPLRAFVERGGVLEHEPHYPDDDSRHWVDLGGS